jgi:hypothetical protein
VPGFREESVVERAFIIMQVGSKDSPERKRADEIYDFIVVPAVKNAGLEPYRADLDPSPGPITPKMLSELLSARVVLADLTGSNPNVYYELGITHSFARPLITIAESSSRLPFDAKDERVIELGEYPVNGLTYAQGEQAKSALQESLGIILSDGYLPPSPLREVAANRSVDDLAPKDPIAAEMAQIRETLEEIRKKLQTPQQPVSQVTRTADIAALREVLRRHVRQLDEEDLEMLATGETSPGQDDWTGVLRKEWLAKRLDRSHADESWPSSRTKGDSADEPSL